MEFRRVLFRSGVTPGSHRSSRCPRRSPGRVRVRSERIAEHPELWAFRAVTVGGGLATPLTWAFGLRRKKVPCYPGFLADQPVVRRPSKREGGVTCPRSGRETLSSIPSTG